MAHPFRVGRRLTTGIATGGLTPSPSPPLAAAGLRFVPRGSHEKVNPDLESPCKKLQSGSNFARIGAIPTEISRFEVSSKLHSQNRTQGDLGAPITVWGTPEGPQQVQTLTSVQACLGVIWRGFKVVEKSGFFKKNDFLGGRPHEYHPA